MQTQTQLFLESNALEQLTNFSNETAVLNIGVLKETLRTDACSR